MALREEFEKTGNWLFRWRSYLPLLLIVLILITVRNFEYPYQSHKLDQLWEIFCLIISFFGLGIRIFTVGCVSKGTSGRNTYKQVADVLNTTGMYSIVRHPLYLGNFFIWFGISLSIRVWWFTIITILIFLLYYEKIMFAEEEFLRRKFGDAFVKWSTRTPAFLPKLKNWQSPSLQFSLKTSLKREYSGFFGIIVSFIFLDIIKDKVIYNKFEFDLMWLLIFAFGLIVYLTLMILKKKTKILEVEGR